MKKTIAVLSLAMLSATAVMAQSAGGQEPPAQPEARGHGKMPPKFKGPLSREQALKHAAERFDRMDANKDGVLTEDEMKPPKGHGPHGPHGPQGPQGPRGPAGEDAPAK